MYAKLKPLIFRFQPEMAHELTMKMLQIACSVPGLSWCLKRWFLVDSKLLEVEVAGLKFPNPVGLAAGFDKDARWLNEMATLGFGFVEIGTITPVSQSGNPKPRLFRLPPDEGIINRMGFNNGGMDEAVKRLKRRPKGLLVGGNIGKNKVTPNEDATSDYEKCFQALHPHVDYFVVNVSSPNTPGLRELQEKEPLAKLLSALVRQNTSKAVQRPIFLKIAPDLTNEQLDDIIELVSETRISGVIATNTTIERSGLKTSRLEVEAIGAGGLSGAPLRERSTEVIRYLHTRSDGAFPIIGVGGICSPQDAIEKLDAGATLLQVYSGLVFAGPGLIKKINQAILSKS
jgi:dihydroorotate dehydrogenase